MSYPRYPQYKDSGIEWLGTIPLHWQLERFKHLFRMSDEKNGSEPFGEMLSVSGYRGIEIKEYEDENQKRSREELVDYRVVRRGQLVVNTMWLNYAGLGVSDFEGYVSPAYRAYYIDDTLDKRFVHHLLRSSNYVAGYTKFMQGIRPNSLQIATDDFVVFPVLLPPLPEQRAIAAFLDRETARIDTLIAKQEQMIALLHEKRKALISHVVTRGLNPDAPLKDSGVEWLGMVPEHWEVTKIRHCTVLNPSKQEISKLPKNTLVSFLPMETIGDDGNLRLEFVKPLAEVETGYTYFAENDVTVAKITPCFENGKGAVMRGLLGQRGFGTTELIVMRPSEVLMPNFLYYITVSTTFRKLGESSMYGAAGQKRVPEDFVRNFFIALPPKSEQQSIVQFIEQESTKIDTLINKAQIAIDLLKEHRTSLISAAVTGKIDVRGLVESEQHEQAS